MSRNHRLDHQCEITDGDEQRLQHRLHSHRIGFAQRPGGLLIDIAIAGPHGLNPGFDALAECQRLELARQILAAGLADLRQQGRIGLVRLEPLQLAIHVLGDHRQRALHQIAEAVRQFGVAAVDDRLGRVAAVLSEGDFAHQEVA